MAGERSVAILETISQTSGFKESTADAKALDSAISGVTLTTKELNKAEISLQGTIDRLDRSLNPAVAALRDYERVQNAVAKQVAQGGGNAEQQARVLEGAAARYQRAISLTGKAVNDNAKNYGLASHQIQNLSFQLNDLAVQIGSGQGLFRPLLQQGAQVLQILQMGEGGIRGSLAGLKDSLAKIGPAAISGFGVAVGAAIGLTTALVSGIAAVNDYREQYNELQRVLTTGAGKQAGLKPGDVQGAAEAASKASRAAGGALSTGEARAVGIELAKTGKIGVEVMTDLTSATEAYAKTLGIDTPTAAKKLGAAFADPAKGADMLAKELLSLSGAQVEQIGTMARMGNQLGAQKLLMQGLKDGVVSLKDEVITATIVWERFKKAALDDADRVAKAIGQAAMPKTPEQRIQDIQALPGTGLGGQVTPEEKQARSDAILKIQADASAKELEAVRKSEEAKRLAYSLTANVITQSVESSIVKFKELQEQSRALTEAMKHPELLADSAATADVLNRVTTALGGATTAAQFYAVQLAQVKAQGDLALQSIYAQTQASLAQTEAERQAAATAQARVAQLQAEFAARQAMQSQQQIEIAGQIAYNQVMAQADAQTQLRAQAAQMSIVQGQQTAAMLAAQTQLQMAQTLAERDAAVALIAKLTYEQVLNAELQKGTSAIQARILAQQAANAVYQQEANARALAEQQADKQIRQGALEIQSIQATTIAERANIAVKQSLLETEGSLMTQEQRLALARQAGQKVLEQATAAIKQKIMAQEGEIRVIQAAIGSVGMERSQREPMLAGMRAENELLQAGYDLRDKYSQKYIENAQAIAALNVQLEEEEALVRKTGGAYNWATGAVDAFGKTLDTTRNWMKQNAQEWRNYEQAVRNWSQAMSEAEYWATATQFSRKGPMTASTEGAMNFQLPMLGLTGAGTPKQAVDYSIKALAERLQSTERGGQGLSPEEAIKAAKRELGRTPDALLGDLKQYMDLSDINEPAKDLAKAADKLGDISALGGPIGAQIDTLRGLQQTALGRAYTPDPYATKNPEFFYNGAQIFKESQDKVFDGLQQQIVKLESLQASLGTLVQQNEQLPQTLVDALIAAGFADIAEKIVAAFKQDAPSATPPQTAVQAPASTNTFQGYGGRRGDFVSVGL